MSCMLYYIEMLEDEVAAALGCEGIDMGTKFGAKDEEVQWITPK